MAPRSEVAIELALAMNAVVAFALRAVVILAELARVVEFELLTARVELFSIALALFKLRNVDSFLSDMPVFFSTFFCGADVSIFEAIDCGFLI